MISKLSELSVLIGLEDLDFSFSGSMTCLPELMDCGKGSGLVFAAFFVEEEFDQAIFGFVFLICSRRSGSSAAQAGGTRPAPCSWGCC